MVTRCATARPEGSSEEMVHSYVHASVLCYGCTRSGVTSVSTQPHARDHSSCHAMLSVPLTLPDEAPLSFARTWPSRDALTTSRSLKHATVDSLDIAAHCASQKQAATVYVVCYDTSRRWKSAERVAPLAGCISTCGVYVAARHLRTVWACLQNGVLRTARVR